MTFPHKVFRYLILVIVLILCSALIYGVWQGKSRKERQMAVADESSGAEMKLTDMEYTEMQEGRRVWNLRAEEAKYFQKEQKTDLTKVRLTFFLENGGEIHLRSEKGMLHAGSKDIELWQAVHAGFPQGYELSTERAYYCHAKNLISSETAILITGPDLKLRGKHWKYEIPDKRAFLEGQVQATLSLKPAKAN